MYQPIPGSATATIGSGQKNSKVVIYAMNKLTDEIKTAEFICPVQFDFMFCIPIYRLVMGFVNNKSGKKRNSHLILIGDVSRQCAVLSKQEISDQVHSVLYIHEQMILLVGGLGRVLVYNTHSIQYTSQPIFIHEIPNLPFEPTEPIIHMCHVTSHKSTGLLSERHFVLWQYSPKQTVNFDLCNPHRFDFCHCHYNSRYNYFFTGFQDGVIILWTEAIKRLRYYHSHYKTITGLESSMKKDILISSSLDRIINVWNLATLQHLYRYDCGEEILHIDVIADNLYFYHTKTNIFVFKLYLLSTLFSLTNARVKSLRLTLGSNRIGRITALSSIYTLQYNGQIILYRAENTPCSAEYIVETKAERYEITCIAIINPSRTHLMSISVVTTTTKKSLEQQAIFFGHANGKISLFQADSLVMKPFSAHESTIVALEASRSSMEATNTPFTTYEVLISAGEDKFIRIWDVIMQEDESISLKLIVTLEQERNISTSPIHFIGMIDNFVVANFMDQPFLHLWQLLNISLITGTEEWGIIEHPTKGSEHTGDIQAITATPKLKLFASSGHEGEQQLSFDKN
ncbi:unnamed protein product [Didymodactylos carnosus]|uniref:WD repeat-containing protein n=1 Tax=Didymodactylos carnosus TaxID=1234261 RepID=A0A814A7U8_9BILA|nr:unnamed protein product [Didymodactylos carnosus]CAF3691439.1 unnamed protein product [Didymodactylos carnosus]